MNITKKISFTIILAILLVSILVPGITPLTNPAHAAISPVKINCVGDSITLGVGTSGGISYPNSYPSRLQLLSGTGTKVGNYGASGYTAMSKCDFPYVLSGTYNTSHKNSPDIVIIMLGLNDAKVFFESPGINNATVPNWDNKADFIPDYVNLVNSYKNLSTHPQVFICTTSPAPGFMSASEYYYVVTNELQPLIREVANQTDVPVIDVFSEMFGHDEFYSTDAHPNDKGAELIANIVYDGIKDTVDEIYAVKNPTQTSAPTVIPTPALTQTATPTLTQTVTPTPFMTPTSTPIATPTATPIPSETPNPSPSPTLTQTPVPSSSFTDMSDFEWARESVARLAFQGIVYGKSNDKFAPGDEITRSEFSALMVRALKLSNETASCEFTDVKTTDWFYSAVASAKQAGIILGRPADETGKFEFAPDENITREDIAVICANTIKNIIGIYYDHDTNATLSHYTDKSEISDYAIDSLSICVISGLIKGVATDTLAPKSYATRAEAAVIIDRIMGISAR